jgi:3-deoxy-D-arabino-heptulosonate 7-phosphate (DAHP) synthase class II
VPDIAVTTAPSDCTGMSFTVAPASCSALSKALTTPCSDCADSFNEKKVRKMIPKTRVNLLISVIFISEWPW